MEVVKELTNPTNLQFQKLISQINLQSSTVKQYDKQF